MEQSSQERDTRIIAVGNQKGGVAKTTNTVHLATALGAIGRRCLIWDLDMNHGATLHFGIPSEGFLGTFEVLIGEEQPEDVIITHDDEDVKLAPFGRTIRLARRTPWYPHYIRDIPPWA